MLEAIKKLIQVKKLIALSLTVTFIILSLKGTIEAKDFMTVFLMIISFYFGQSTTRQAINESKKNE